MNLAERAAIGREIQMRRSQMRKIIAVDMRKRKYATSFVARFIGVSERQIQRYVKEEL